MGVRGLYNTLEPLLRIISCCSRPGRAGLTLSDRVIIIGSARLNHGYVPLMYDPAPDYLLFEILWSAPTVCAVTVFLSGHHRDIQFLQGARKDSSFIEQYNYVIRQCRVPLRRPRVKQPSHLSNGHDVSFL